jgi:DNA repair exonuclease SbcCD ATPase subunit
MEISRTSSNAPQAQASASNPPSATRPAAASSPPARSDDSPPARADNGAQAAAAAPRGGALTAQRDQLKAVNSELAAARNALAQASERREAYMQEAPQRVDQTFHKMVAAEDRFIEAREKWTTAPDPTSPTLNQFKQEDKAAMQESRRHQLALRNVPKEMHELNRAEASAQQQVDHVETAARDLQQAIRKSHHAELSPEPTQMPSP